MAVAAGKVLLHGGPKQLVMVFQTLDVVRRLQERLEQFQEHGGVAGLGSQGVQKRTLPGASIPLRRPGPSQIEFPAFPTIVDGGPKLVSSRIGPEHHHHHPPTVAVGLIAIQLDKAIVPVGQIVSSGDGHRAVSRAPSSG